MTRLELEMAEGTVAERWFEGPRVGFDLEADRLRRVAAFEAWMARERCWVNASDADLEATLEELTVKLADGRLDDLDGFLTSTCARLTAELARRKVVA